MIVLTVLVKCQDAGFLNPYAKQPSYGLVVCVLNKPWLATPLKT